MHATLLGYGMYQDYKARQIELSTGKAMGTICEAANEGLSDCCDDMSKLKDSTRSWWGAQPGDEFYVSGKGNYEASIHAAQRMKPSSSLVEISEEVALQSGYDKIVRLADGTHKYYIGGKGIPATMVEDILANPKTIGPGNTPGTLIYEGCYTKMGAGGRERIVQVVVSDDTEKIITILTNLISNQ